MPLLLKIRQRAVRALPDAIRIFFVNRNLKRQLDAWETNPAFDDIRALNADQLEKYLETEWTRAKELDEKLNKLTASLSVAVTVGGVVSKTVFDGLAATSTKTVIAALLFLSMGMFLLGAMIGFSGLRPKPRYGYGAGYLRIITQGGDQAEDAMRAAASGFQIMNAIRSNEASTAIGLIRNGVLVFTLAMATSFFAPVMGQNTSTLQTSTAKTMVVQTHGPQAAIPIRPPEPTTTKPEPITENKPTGLKSSPTSEVPSRTVPSEEGKAHVQSVNTHLPAAFHPSFQKNSRPMTAAKCCDCLGKMGSGESR
ncbi:hypothetical protein [Komagataeibacter xylinus]|uniref:hypothetical protein n=1 Tax=Komagataeibacter xylinus TaxID=28448 RepID=UPI00280C045D|nr:hypothetical protein [Komagataeibacter xylinus]